MGGLGREVDTERGQREQAAKRKREQRERERRGHATTTTVHNALIDEYRHQAFAWQHDSSKAPANIIDIAHLVAQRFREDELPVVREALGFLTGQVSPGIYIDYGGRKMRRRNSKAASRESSDEPV